MIDLTDAKSAASAVRIYRRAVRPRALVNLLGGFSAVLPGTWFIPDPNRQCVQSFG